jgi:hypothetical protein
MTTRLSPTTGPNADISEALEEAVSFALQKWRLVSGHTSQYWLRGYCACFATTLLRFIGKPAGLGSALANDGIVHHIVVTIGDLTIDARGVNTRESLLAEINREAEAHRHSLRAVEVVPFELEHARLLKDCPENELRKLRTCFNSTAIRNIRHRIKAAALAAFKAQSSRVASDETHLREEVQV